MKSLVLKILFITAMLFSTSYLYSQQVQLTVKFDHETCAYGVYAKPDFTDTDFFVAGGSQITVVFPASVGNSSVSVTSLEGGPWFDSSQIYAPTAASTLDFHAFSSNGSSINFTSGVEVLLFTFELPDSCCTPGVRLFENGSDPDSSAPGMGGGDFNNYFADAFFFIDCYDGNYNNSITVATPTGDAAQDFCAVNTPTVGDLVANEADVVWYDAATNGNVLNDGTILTDGTVYYGALEPGSCESATRLAVTVNINDATTPTGDTTQSFCIVNSPTVADIVAGGGTVTWYDAATGGNIILGGSALVDGNTYYGSLANGSCISSVRLAVTINLNDAATPTGDATQDFCVIDNPTVSNLVTIESSVTWYDAATGGNIIAGGTALVDGQLYYGSLTDGVSGCAGSTRFAVTVEINDAAIPTGDSTQDFCAIDSPTVNNLVTNEGSVTWYDAATGGNIVSGVTSLTDGSIYYGSLTDAVSGCAGSVRFVVTVNVGDANAPTGDAAQDFCAIDTPTVNDLVANEASVIWYDAPTGGNIVNGTELLLDGETYYGSQVIGSCSSSVRLAVTVNINNPPAPTTTDDTQEFCGYANPTLANIQINESNITWYAASSGGSVLASGTALVNNTTYYASYTDAVSGCESTSRLPVTITLTSVCDVALTIKVMLQGALTGVSDNLMRDNLRASGLIPLAQPYNSALNARFTQINNTGGETTNTTVLNANAGTGNAVVDWVFIEIRDGVNAATIIKTISALVQRDGDIMAADGSPLVVPNLPESFFVSVKHRNHFGAMGANVLTVSGGQATIDFTTLTGTALFSLPGNDSGLSMASVAGGLRALYAGNANYDIRVKYDGLTNDRQTMGSQVLSHTGNTTNALNFSNATGYFSGDINMDGKVLYDGSNNDRGVLQNIVINYPENTSDLNNYNNMTEQIPQ